MEFGSVLEFLENKTILLTGATGFLAKIFLEKILRVQPKVKKLYLLLRAADAKSASDRFHNEFLGRDLFKLVKEMHGANLNSFISKKIALVPGDVCYEDLGVKDLVLKEEMRSEIDIVVNFAATTNFDERYDVAFGANTLGAKHALCFAKECNKMIMFVHVSTAYVAGEPSGIVLENPCRMGGTLNGASGLNVDEEKKLIDEKLKQLRADGAAEGTIKEAMKDFGMERARTYGWPNTYVFTKAVGEMLIGDLKGNLPVVIIRPAMVTSTYKEPFSGWIEGVKTIDALTVAYGKGKLSCFLADISAVVDLIPADMVVNATIMAMVAHANQPSYLVYHVGSSAKNPVRYANLRECGYRHFAKHPWIGKDGQPVKVAKIKVLDSMDSFHRYMAFRYLLMLKGLGLANAVFCKYFQDIYGELDRKINIVMKLVDLYRPYLFFQGIFDDANTEKLRMAARQNNGVENDVFFFDPRCIDWDDYLTNTHAPGVVRFCFK